ncbi:MAG: hypothetical protein QW117_00055 [Candidatus Pacearchaeota archaeon]
MVWIIILIAIVFIYLIIKIKHAHNKFFITLIILALLFLYLSIYSVVKTNNIDVKSMDGMIMAGKAYIKWVGNVIDNTKTIIGNAIRLNWGPPRV